MPGGSSSGGDDTTAATGDIWNEHGGSAHHKTGGGGTSSGGGSEVPAEALAPCPEAELGELACGVVNPRPRRAHDFRGLPRRVEAAGGAVAADSSRCSQIGAAVLDDGGAAADAAVATALCLGVVNPVSSGLVSFCGVERGAGQ